MCCIDSITTNLELVSLLLPSRISSQVVQEQKVVALQDSPARPAEVIAVMAEIHAVPKNVQQGTVEAEMQLMEVEPCGTS